MLLAFQVRSPTGDPNLVYWLSLHQLLIDSDSQPDVASFQQGYWSYESLTLLRTELDLLSKNMASLDTANKVIGAATATTGALLSLVSGPMGVLAAAAVSVLDVTAKDMASRTLSQRERIRLDNSIEYIADSIRRGLLNKQVPRQDGFFNTDTSLSNNAAELLEGVLLKCRAQFQEKKVQLVSSIFSYVTFNASVSEQAAYQVLNLVDRLTFNHLCLIAYYGRRDEFEEFNILNSRFHEFTGKLSEDVMSVARDLLLLFQEGILLEVNGNSFFEHTVIRPSQLGLAVRGQMIFDMLEMEKVMRSDILLALKDLEYQEAWGPDMAGKINGR
ncbi:hypothetical protein [Hymenobacter baengnokdamensis]|uniref:hypothetical protein n=1 Tax=Hymenobacter baengnokdamensis TaxID=2615203 RepID=UPI0012478708|nr:hypothetical protein [Hymenobacter baengnokdamensis]